MAWKRFESFDESFTPKISIRATGHIGFSVGATNKFGIREYKCCELFYEEGSRLIGFRFGNSEEKGATTKVVARDLDCFVAAKPFLDFHGIKYKPTKSYYGQLDKESGLVVIDLKDPMIIHGRRGKKPQDRRAEPDET